MKTLYLIGGTMGVGKTAVCRELQKMLPNCAFLDGDWCWSMAPFVVNAETKAMALDNICHVLTNFLNCSHLENILFCWVMHEQQILDELLSRLDTRGWEVRCISLVCTGEALGQRLEKDIAAGLREADVLQRSIPRLPLYEALHTIKIDTTGKDPVEAAKLVIRRKPEAKAEEDSHAESREALL